MALCATTRTVRGAAPASSIPQTVSSSPRVSAQAADARRHSSRTGARRRGAGVPQPSSSSNAAGSLFHASHAGPARRAPSALDRPWGRRTRGKERERGGEQGGAGRGGCSRAPIRVPFLSQPLSPTFLLLPLPPPSSIACNPYKSTSRSDGRTTISRSAAPGRTSARVSRARRNGEQTTRETGARWRRAPAAWAWSRPLSVRTDSSDEPWRRPAAFQVDSPAGAGRVGGAGGGAAVASPPPSPCLPRSLSISFSP